MTSWDYHVGFEREPRDLDAFLDVQGYNRIPKEKDNMNKEYESREGGLVELFYCSELVPVDEGEVPDWSKSGTSIISDIMISTKDINAVEEASILADKIAIKYNGVTYDSDVDEFFRSKDI